MSGQFRTLAMFLKEDCSRVSKMPCPCVKRAITEQNYGTWPATASLSSCSLVCLARATPKKSNFHLSLSIVIHFIHLYPHSAIFVHFFHSHPFSTISIPFIHVYLFSFGPQLSNKPFLANWAVLQSLQCFVLWLPSPESHQKSQQTWIFWLTALSHITSRASWDAEKVVRTYIQTWSLKFPFEGKPWKMTIFDC